MDRQRATRYAFVERRARQPCRAFRQTYGAEDVMRCARGACAIWR